MSNLVKRSSKNGMGVFTTVDISNDSPVCEFKGELFTKETLVHDSSQILQVSHNLYLGPSGQIDDFINHSCNPNCVLHIVGNRAFLYARHLITAGAEITFDYSTSSTDNKDNWNMICNCGTVNCRKEISGYQYLSDSKKEEYKKAGLIPLFLTNAIFQKGV